MTDATLEKKILESQVWAEIQKAFKNEEDKLEIPYWAKIRETNLLNRPGFSGDSLV